MTFTTSNTNASNAASSHTQNLDEYHACIKEIEQETSGQHITSACMQQMAIKRMAEKRMNAKKNNNNTTEEKNNTARAEDRNSGRISFNINEHFKRGTAQLKNMLKLDDDNDINNAPTMSNTFSSTYQQQHGRPQKLITQLNAGNRYQQQQHQQQQQQQQPSQQQPCIMRRGSDADPMGRIDPKQLQMLRDMAASYSSLDTNGADNDNDDNNSDSTSSSLLSAAIERAFRQKAGLSFSSIAEALEDIAGDKNNTIITDFPNVDLNCHASFNDTSPVDTPKGGQQSPTIKSSQQQQQQQQQPKTRKTRPPQKKRLSLTKQLEKSIHLTNIHELEELNDEELSVSMHLSSQFLAYDAEADQELSESSSLDHNEGSLICRWNHEKKNSEDSQSSTELSLTDLKKISDEHDRTEEEGKEDDMNINTKNVPHEVNLGGSNSTASSWKDGNESASTLICKFGPRPTRRVSDISMGDIQEAALSFPE